MKFGRGIDQFIKWFYICGLSCYPGEIWTAKFNHKKRFIKYIPTIGQLVLVSITSIGTSFWKFHLNYNPINYSGFVHVSIILLTMAFTVFVCALQMVFLSSYFDGIRLRIDIIERLSFRRFSFDSEVFQHHFMLRLYIISVAFIIPFFLTMHAQPTTLDYLIVNVGMHIPRAFIFLNLLQAFFYADLFDHLMRSFVRFVEMRALSIETIDSIVIRSPTAKQLKIELFQFKLLHFKLWEISENINHIFGWVILVVFLQYFMIIIHNVYFAYTKLTDQPLSIVDFFRKYGYLTERCSID